MTYEEGKEKLVEYCISAAGATQIVEVFPNMQIQYPAGKRVGDYLLLVSGKALSHSAVCVIVASYIMNGTMTYKECVQLMEDVYSNGIEKYDESQQKAFLRNLFYWTTLQEEINYPQAEGKQGRAMSFKRYAEAAAAAVKGNSVTLKDAMQRAENWKLAKDNPRLQFDGQPSFY